VAERATATHDFVVTEYSKLEMLGIGQYVSSDAFRAGGHDWKIRVYPKPPLAPGEGDSPELGGIADYRPPFFPGGASLHLCDPDEDTELTVRFTLSVLHRDGRVSPMASRTRTEIFGAPPRQQRHGFNRLVHGSMLRWRCIHNDALTIRCTLTVVGTRDPVPPPELAAHIGRLLRTGMGADVTFQVGGRAFPAHRVILAARSPVFSAELFGHMMEKDATCIKIVGMRPKVFELLLQFIYTEALPGDGEGCDAATMQHLLVAADRYGLDRLRQICELKLRASVDEETVASMLALAECHNCPGLRDVCVACMSSLDQ
jgi:speckle-type POZ protein